LLAISPATQAAGRPALRLSIDAGKAGSYPALMDASSPLLPELTVFFPFRNEAACIVPVVEQARQRLLPLVGDLEMLLINDGSTDATGELADALATRFPDIHVIHHPVPLGYGAALISGFRTAGKAHILYLDGDGQFDAGDLARCRPLLPGYDLIAGYRLARADPFIRRLSAGLFRFAFRLCYGLPVRDIDCAFKLVRREIVAALPLASSGLLIDAELLIRTKRAGYRIDEIGVRHLPRLAGQSAVFRPAVIRQMLRDFLDFPRLLADRRPTNAR